MKDLIEISQVKIGKDRVESICAKNLYVALNVEENFFIWIKKQISKLNLIKNMDFKKYKKEYILSLDSAKCIVMMSKTKKAFEIKEYFKKREIKKEKLKNLAISNFKEINLIILDILNDFKSLKLEFYKDPTISKNYVFKYSNILFLYLTSCTNSMSNEFEEKKKNSKFINQT